MRRTRSLAITGALALSTAPLVGALMSPASADTLGQLSFQPSSGTVDDVLDMTTSGPCPADAKLGKVRIVGAGFPARGQNLTGTKGGVSNTAPFAMTTEFTLRDSAALTYPAVTYKGTYTVQVVCVVKGVTEAGTFDGQITFSDPARWVAGGSPSTVTPGPTVSLPVVKPTPAPSASASRTAAPSTGAAASSTPRPSASAGSTASPSASTSATTSAPSPGSASATASASSEPAANGSGTPSASGGDGVTASAPSSSSQQGSPWPPLLLGVVLGGGVVGAGMALYQRRTAPGADS